MKIHNIEIPVNFSIEKPYVKDFVCVLDKLYDKRVQHVSLNFTKRKISKSAIVVLSAQVEKIQSERKFIVHFKALPSKYLNPNNVIRLKRDGIVIDIYNIIRKNLVDSKFNILDPAIFIDINKALDKIGISGQDADSRVYLERIEALFSEVMGNAIEHGLLNRSINCWLTSEIDSDGKRVIFTFVDMGLGIARSYRKASAPWRYILMKDKNIVLRSLAGKMGSSTKDPHRGRGIPEIRKIVEEGYVADFELITNKVAINYSDSTFDGQIIPNFRGTCYSWTITKNNFEIWKNTK